MLRNQNTGSIVSVGFDVKHVAGCLLGGAVGDALGSPVEFMRLLEIHREFGPRGILNPPILLGLTPISDDTQMSLFTAEGLLRAIACDEGGGQSVPVEVLYRAYLRWLYTQGMRVPVSGECFDTEIDGWLVDRRAMFARRAPGYTCLSALGSGKMGTVQDPINDSKECGGVVRVAPVGLVPSVVETFSLAADAAAITHGHPTAYLAAGAFASIVRCLMEGACLQDALVYALSLLRQHSGHEEVRAAIKHAMDQANRTVPSPEIIESIGSGWIADEALAVAVYCSLVHSDDYVAAVRLAANHSGDSNTTAAMTGNLMGALLGRDAIPDSWLERLELREEIELIASDLANGFSDSVQWYQKYPGW